MSRILAIDLGKFKSVTCLLDSDTNQTEFWTMADEDLAVAIWPSTDADGRNLQSSRSLDCCV